MNRFTVDFSSSPAGSEQYLPSQTPQKSRNIFSQPEQLASTTPLAPPPSQVYGSSASGTNTTRQLFSFQKSNHESSGRPKSRLFQQSTNTEMTEDGGEDDMEEDEVEEEGEDFGQSTASSFAYPNKSRGAFAAPSLMKFSPEVKKQSLMRSTRRPSRVSKSQLPRKGRPEIIPGLARDMSRQGASAGLVESDEVILSTEQVLRQLEEACQNAQDDAGMQAIISEACQELVAQWARNSKPQVMSFDRTHLGPDPGAPPFEKARYLASMLLELYQPLPEPIDLKQSLVLSDSVMSTTGAKTVPMPLILLNWLDTNHVNYRPLFEQVMSTSPNCTASDLFWDALESFTLRGKFTEVMQLLAEADFNYAVIDTPQGFQDAGFTGTQLQVIQSAVFRARQVFNACPAVQDGDWAINGQDWDMFRKTVEAALDDLVELADDHGDNDGLFRQPPSKNLFDRSDRRAGLPFTIHQHLRTMYNVLLGDANEIIGLAQDWLEATFMLTAWWNGSEEAKVAQWSFDVSRANNLTDVREGRGDPYLERLKESFLCVTDPDTEDSFQLNAMSPVEVGIGAILQGDMQSVLRILKTLSLCTVSSIAEVGTWAGWITSASSAAGLDQDDLMVLNYGSNDTTLTKDDILSRYAHALFDRDTLHTSDGSVVEGWELAFSITSRMDDEERIQTCISELLDGLSVVDQDRAEKLVSVCEQLGLREEGRKVSETFGDHLVNNTTEYGTALLCYARAHSEQKVRQLVDLLNSYCLVQSQAYPVEGEIDAALERLVSNPRSALSSIAEVDAQAAETLQFHLVGYACIRKFYTVRDEKTIMGVGGRKITLQPLARKKAAAKVLVAAINSAADSIYGGLYDSERQSAIQVDGLLTLLGEVTALLARGNDKRVLTSDQMYAVLAAIEDLQTVSDRVYRASEECMEAAVRNYYGSQPPSPHAMLKKSISSGTNSNFSFSMMGSEMLSRSGEELDGKSVGSAVLVGKDSNGSDRSRGWDWRTHFRDQGTTGADVLTYLRVGIAKELSLASLEHN